MRKKVYIVERIQGHRENIEYSRMIQVLYMYVLSLLFMIMHKNLIRHSVDRNQAFSWSICLFDDIFINRSTFNMHFNIFLEMKHLYYYLFFNYSPVIRELLNKEKGWKRDTNDYDTLDVRMNRSKVCKDIYIYTDIHS